jgi:putative phosphoribosyl transferase
MAMAEAFVEIPADEVDLAGVLDVPAHATGVVAFAHGSGSGRSSPRNAYVAAKLREHGLGTLLLDLLMPAEEAVYATRFDIALLTRRLARAIDWLGSHAASALPIGLFGASTGVAAVVSRGGRPDLAGEGALAGVCAPTLLIVGGADTGVIELNLAAYAVLRCERCIEVVPGATHLFEEPGALERVARLASAWFVQHLHAAQHEAAPAR